MVEVVDGGRGDKALYSVAFYHLYHLYHLNMYIRKRGKTPYNAPKTPYIINMFELRVEVVEW